MSTKEYIRHVIGPLSAFKARSKLYWFFIGSLCFSLPKDANWDAGAVNENRRGGKRSKTGAFH